MGFIHDTGSDIFAIETRRESAILHDSSETGNHLFLPYTRHTRVRDNIVRLLMKAAGDWYSKGNEAKAEEYKNAARLVQDLAINDGGREHGFEASYEWLKEFVHFALSNDKLKKELALETLETV